MALSRDRLTQNLLIYRSGALRVEWREIEGPRFREPTLPPGNRPFDGSEWPPGVNPDVWTREFRFMGEIPPYAIWAEI